MKDYPPYFKASELMCKCGKCDGGEMDDGFMLKINLIREACGFPFIVNSAFRCEAHNKSVGGVAGSDHTRGLGLDIAVYNPQAMIIVQESVKFLNRIGISQKDGLPRYIHLGGDSSPYAIWSY